jgi:hypothetical protein
VPRQPAISFSISFQNPFNRAGGRTSNVRQKIMEYWINTKLVTYMERTDRQLNIHFGASVLIVNGPNQSMGTLQDEILGNSGSQSPWLDLISADYKLRMIPLQQPCQ